MDAMSHDRLSDAEPAAAGVPECREPSRWELIREAVRMIAGAADNLSFMLLASGNRFHFRRLERQGRRAEVEEIIQRMTLDWTSSIFAKLGCRVEVEGGELVPREGPLLVMPNHQSVYDIPLLMGWLGRPVGFVFKRELLRFPGLRYWMLQIHGYAIDRGEHRDAAEQYNRWGDEIAAAGRALVIFPEGTRSRDSAGALGAFRRGALRLATPRSIPILPVVIDGTRLLVRPRALALNPPGKRVVRMRILPPRVTQPMTPPESKRFMENLREAMAATRDSIRVNWG